MNFSKLTNVMLTENPIVELDSKQLTMIAGGSGSHGCGCGGPRKPKKRKKSKSSKSSKKSSK